jgi:subfamily B ATP-binding cassette protein MsbA
VKTFLRIVRYVRPHFGALAVANVFMLLFIVFNVISIGLIMPLVDIVFNPPVLDASVPTSFSITNLSKYVSHWLSGLVARHNRLDVLLWLTIGIVVSFLLKNLFSFANTMVMAKLEQSIMHQLRVDVYSHLQDLSLSYFVGERKGRLMSSVVNDTRIVHESAMSLMNGVFRDPPQILLFAGVLFLYDWKLTLMVATMLPVIGLVISRIADQLKKYSVDLQEKMADTMSVLDETFANVRVVKAFGMEEFEKRRFTSESLRFASLVRTILRRRAFAAPMSELFGVLAVAAILWFKGKGVIMGEDSMTPGGLILYITVVTQMIQPLKQFGQVFNSVQEGIAAGERVFGLLDTKPLIVEKPNAFTIETFRRSIRYENVSFKYETGDVVLRNVTFEINAGERIAIVGPSGGGKSTLVDLLPRFYDPLEGRITIDGVDIRDLTVASLRGLMGIVTQETILFNDSVRNNIAYGRAETPLEDVIAAAKVANAHEFIMRLPNGYDTRIGDRGTKLSGGQRQRLSLARAILKNPPILIFDEATSALDTESELLVQEAVERTLAGRTSVVIAHRLSTIQHSDRIIVIEKGQIVEEGSHLELIANSNGTYKRLYDLQFQM